MTHAAWIAILLAVSAQMKPQDLPIRIATTDSGPSALSPRMVNGLSSWATPMPALKRIVTSDHLDMLEHDRYLVAQGCTRRNYPHAPPDPTHTQVQHFYELRSGMVGWFSVMQNTNDWTREQHDAARREIGLYKSQLRPLIRDAQLFHIAPRPDGIHWDGIEYWDPARHKGVVFAFHGSSTTEPRHQYVLVDLDPSKSYRLHFEDGSSQDCSISGRELMQKGISVVLPQPLTSELIFLSAE